MRRCELCDDTGLVTVWHPSVIRHHVLKEPAPMTNLTHVTACKCSKGDRYTIKTRRNGDTVDWLPRYQSSWWHCRTKGGYTDPAKDIEQQGINLPNHEPSFDTWNQTD